MSVDTEPRTVPASGQGRRRARRRRVLALLGHTLVVAGLLGTAVALSAPALGPSSLWLDDAWIALVHRLHDLPDVLAAGLTAPGFALLLKGWLSAVGFSEVAAQALPFAAAVALPPAVYLVGRRIGLTAPGAALAAVVLLLSPVRVEYAGRVKPFAVDALAAVVMVWLAWRTAERPEDHRRWALLSIVSLAATLVSTSSAVVAVAAMGGATLAAWGTPAWRRALRWSAGYALSAGAWVFGMVAPRLGPELRDYWAGRYLEGAEDLGRVVRAFGSDLVNVEHDLAVVVLASIVAMSFAVAAFRRTWQAAILAGPLAIAAALAVLGRAPLGTGRTDLYLYPTIALAAAWALHHVSSRLGGAATARWLSVIALAAVAVAGLPPPDAGYPAEDFRALTAVVEGRLGDDDLLLLTASTVYGAALYGPWTAGIEPAGTTTGFSPVFDDDRVLRAPGQEHADQLLPTLQEMPDGAHVWVFSSRTSEDAGEEVRDVLARAGWRLDRRWDADGATLGRWFREAPEG